MISCIATNKPSASSSYFLPQPDLFRRSGELFQHAFSPVAAVERARAACEKETLASVFFVDLILVGQIVANGAHVKVASLNEGFHRLGQRRLYSPLSCIRVSTARDLQNN